MSRSRRKRAAPPERRAAFRFPVSGIRRDGQLKIGEIPFPVVVVDESAGGFAVEFDHIADCRAGDMLMLHVGDEWFKVLVVFIDMEDVGVERFEGCHLTSRTRLGLKRISDDETWEMARQCKGSMTLLRRPRMFALTQSMLGSAVAIVAGLCVIGGGILYALNQSRPLNPIDGSHSEARVAKIRNPLELAPKAVLSLKHEVEKHRRSIGSEPDSREPWKPTGTDKKTKRGSASSETRNRQLGKLRLPSVPPGLLKGARKAAEAPKLSHLPNIKLDRGIIRSAQPDFLLRPDISRQLGLTEAQRMRLRRLMVESRTAAKSLSEVIGEDDPQLILGRRSLGLLTTEQKQALSTLQQNQSPESVPDNGDSSHRTQPSDPEPSRNS